MKPNQSWWDSVRSRFGGNRPGSSVPVRRRSRSEQEARHTRLFQISMVACALIIAVVLGAGAIYEYVLKPSAVLAEVNGHEIQRRDYWQYQSVVLYQQARQYEAFASQTAGQQQQQFLQFAASFDAQRRDVWGSTEVSAITIQQMIEDQIYLQGAESLGIAVTDDMAQEFALNQFAPPDAPLMTPPPSPTMSPERAQMATETAEAMLVEESLALGTPVAPPAPGATPIAPDGTPMATPVTDVTPMATPDLRDSLTTANAEYGIFQDIVFDEANMSESDYIRLWTRPQMARQLVDHHLTSQVPQYAEQVNAQHILTATQDLADQMYAQATGGADFDALALANSTDTVTASTGGQLGWFTRLEVDPAFADVAFSLQPGQVSQPVQTPFGWHIIRVNDHDPERALTETQYALATSDAIESWIEEQRAQADISSDYETDVTPTPGSFVPPANAPTPVPATPIPVDPTPEPPLVGPVPVEPGTPEAPQPDAATPIGIASPGADTTSIADASPEATPASSVGIVATPIGLASPVASPAATPDASPEVATPTAP